jgi:uncharacterized protein YdhG (YjbR/CyaY superfamily)
MGKPENVEKYMAGFPDDIQKRLRQIRNTIIEALPQVEEKIRYGMPAFKMGKEHIYISACKQHIGLYPVYGLDEMEDALSPFRGKGTKDALHFPHGETIPIDLIKRIVFSKYQRSR